MTPTDPPDVARIKLDLAALRAANEQRRAMKATATDAPWSFIAHARDNPVEDQVDALIAEVERLRAAVLREREACAKIAEEVHHQLASDPFLNDHAKASSGAYQVAAAIRARTVE